MADRPRVLLIAARQKAGLTQATLAGKLGHPQSYVAKVEAGTRRLDVLEFLDVTAAIGVDPRRIIGSL